MIILKHVSNDKGIRHQDDVVFHLFCRIPDGLCQMQSLSKFVGGTLDPDGVSQIYRFWPGLYLATCSLLIARIVRTNPVSMLSTVYSNDQPHLWQDYWLEVPSLDFASSPPQTGQTTYRFPSFFLLVFNLELPIIQFLLPVLTYTAARAIISLHKSAVRNGIGCPSGAMVACTLVPQFSHSIQPLVS